METFIHHRCLAALLELTDISLNVNHLGSKERAHEGLFKRKLVGGTARSLGQGGPTTSKSLGMGSAFISMFGLLENFNI